jgi:type IV pilus assembly protein PilC
MAVFSYEAVDRSGKKFKSEIDAANSQEAADKIRKMGHFPTAVKEKAGAKSATPAAGQKGGPTGVVAGKKSGGFNLSRFGGVSNKQLSQFTTQLAVLQNAGLPLLRSLKILSNQLKPSPLKYMVQDVADDVEGGSTLSDAMSKHPKAFDKLYVNMIKAGEIGGVLDTILNRLATFMEKSQALKRKIIGAMAYPAVVIVVAVLILAVIMTKVIPEFEKVFKELAGKEGLPVMTQVVLNTASVVQNFWFLIPGIPLGFYLIFVAMSRSEKGKFTLDMMRLRMPLLGIIIRKAAIARFCRTFGTLLASGVPILEALTIVRNAIGNEVIAAAIQKTHDSIREGESIAGPLAHSRVFEDMVIDMIEVGEETGELDKMLMKIADTYESEVDILVGSLTSIIEPLIIVFLGGAVGFIVVALFMPLVSLMQNLGGGK